ncbi:hypothetical protein CXG81DRAFT_23120 [Caulochytrium protostelioides]|uniref:ADF-H domain-containing protein n=1 Tax=Caulochytrium protostelioides TaxID=1555241 RepID=A0A4P9XFH9_9FUNG|nr:hypothetical protein CXG81DRAFT_23120 [Caulochytrium protostelioides]|eukprot:RKP04345.1 hypothetical protein CXG81DRAFT_23120 [Caulochytrium protostelioides]
MALAIKYEDEAAVKAALQAVRSDANETNWALLGHPSTGTPADFHTIVLVASGTDGIDGLKAHLSAKAVQYAFVRVMTRIDMSDAVKFIYIYNLGAEVGPQKGRFGVVKGTVTTTLFQPLGYHVDTEIEGPDELDADELMRRVQEAAGTYNNVHDIGYIEGKQVRGYTTTSSQRDADPGAAMSRAATSSSNLAAPRRGSNAGSATASQSDLAGSRDVSPAAKSAARPSANTASTALDVRDDLRNAIRQVRDDKSPITWCAARYEGKPLASPLGLAGLGTNEVGLAGLQEHLKRDGVTYALARCVDVVDGHNTVKFGFISFMGPELPIMARAKASTSVGAVQALFQPYHVDFNISDPSEISDESFLNKVQTFSGSKSFVR